MAVINLKFQEYSGYPSISTWKGVAYEFRKNSLCSINEIPANLRVSPMRPTLSGNLQSANLFLFGSILCMAFAQLAYRESLRDIEVCLRARQEKLYHMGIRSKISRSTLAYTNENRD
jgi:hypothetical protein